MSFLTIRVTPESRDQQLVAGSQAGGYAVAAGEAMARSLKTHQPVDIAALLAGRR